MKKREGVIQKLTRLQAALPKITEKQIAYAKNNLFDANGTESRGVVMCTLCGHTWKVKGGENITNTECPHCKAKLVSITHHSLRYNDTRYFCITLKKCGYQVVRYYQFRKRVKPGEVNVTYAEVGAKWINERGAYYDFCRPRSFMPKYVDSFDFFKPIKYRRKTYIHYMDDNLLSYLHPSAVWCRSVLPKLKRNGWKSGIYDVKIDSVIINLLSNPKFESYYKTGNIGLCQAIIANAIKCYNDTIDWERIIKICLRHGVKFAELTDWTDYKDYVKDLQFFGFDIFNIKYLIPEDFQKAHLELSAERHRVEAERERERIRQRHEREAKDKEHRRVWMLEYPVRFFDMNLCSNNFTIKPLITYEDFDKEYEAMGHCIRTYYGKADTLLISIEHDGVKAETAEISLSHNTVIQCRGKNNLPSEWHDEIVKFVSKSMDEFQKRYRKKITIPTTTLPAVIYPNLLGVA